MINRKSLYLLPVAGLFLLLTACEDPGKAVSTSKDSTGAEPTPKSAVAEVVPSAPEKASESDGTNGSATQSQAATATKSEATPEPEEKEAVNSDTAKTSSAEPTADTESVAKPGTDAADEQSPATQAARPMVQAAFAEQLIQHAKQAGWAIAVDTQDNVFLFPPGTMAAYSPN